MDLLELCTKLQLPEDAVQMLQEVKVSDETYAQMKAVYWKNDNAFYQEVLKEKNAKEMFLWYYCRMACETYDEYVRRGISEEIYWDTFKDLKIWCEHCFKEHGVYGVAVYDWFWRALSLQLFRFGRLQFEIMEDEIAIHIPQGPALLWSECEKSLEQAYAWFGKEKKYTCHSWLLFPGLKDILPENSNIMEFQKHFHVEKLDYNEREAEWRVFGPVLRVIADYPEETRLQKAAKAYLLSGKALGCGYGYLINS